jgi:hypothetical protein
MFGVPMELTISTASLQTEALQAELSVMPSTVIIAI